MNVREALKQEVEHLVHTSKELLKLAQSIDDFTTFNSEYHTWYTKSIKVIAALAPDRLDEFLSYYKIDSRRKHFSASTYVIQDYLRGTSPRLDSRNETPLWNVRNSLSILILNQSNIIKSLLSHLEGVISDIQGGLLAEIQDAELMMAEKLKKISPRAAGALVGVVLEDHLQRVAADRKVKIPKRNPTVSDLNDPLKQAGIYETATWRKIQFLADLRNLCAHKKEREPTLEEVDELIIGVNWAVKNII